MSSFHTGINRDKQEDSVQALVYLETLNNPCSGKIWLSFAWLLLRAPIILQYRDGHKVFSVVTCPVECGTDDPSGSVNKLVLGIKHRSNEVFTLQGRWEAAVFIGTVCSPALLYERASVWYIRYTLCFLWLPLARGSLLDRGMIRYYGEAHHEQSQSNKV